MLHMLSGFVAGLASLVLPLTVCAQAYPAKSIRLVVPYAPGGAVDAFARPMAQRLSEQIGCELRFKLENLQITGSFKDRGACCWSPSAYRSPPPAPA